MGKVEGTSDGVEEGESMTEVSLNVASLSRGSFSLSVGDKLGSADGMSEGIVDGESEGTREGTSLRNEHSTSEHPMGCSSLT